jgi:hypothetical protein
MYLTKLFFKNYFYNILGIVLNYRVNYTNTPEFIMKLHLTHLIFKKNTPPSK